MRLLFIYYDASNYFGGPIVHARRLLPELRRRGHEIHCLIFRFDDGAPSADFLVQHGIPCSVRPFTAYAEDHVSWILERVSSVQPDVFIPNLSVAGFYAARWAREAGIPTIAVHRSDDAFHWAMIERFVCGDPQWTVSGLVCVNDELRQRTLEHAPGHIRVRTIPSGVPICDRFSSQEGPLRLVYVGRMDQHQKRVHDVVDSLARVLRRRKDLAADLIGSGKESSAIRHLIDRQDLQGRLRFRGLVPSTEIQDELRKYHVIVLLSDYEGTPIAVMDAMAAGLVPVCLDIPGGVRELVIHGETGLLVRNRGRDFEKAIMRLAKDQQLRRRLAANAREHVRANFSLEITADRWEELCAELASAGDSHSTVVAPRDFSLPDPHPGLAREDQRRPVADVDAG